MSTNEKKDDSLCARVCYVQPCCFLPLCSDILKSSVFFSFSPNNTSQIVVIAVQHFMLSRRPSSAVVFSFNYFCPDVFHISLIIIIALTCCPLSEQSCLNIFLFVTLPVYYVPKMYYSFAFYEL